MNLRRTLGVLGLACALAAGGCGGDEEEPESDPTAGFTVDVSALCFDQGIEQSDLTVENLPFDSPKDEAAHAEQINAVTASYDDEFEAVEPPQDLAASYEKYLGIRTEVAKLRADLPEAMAAEDTEAATAINEKTSELRDERLALAKKMNIEGCDNELPDDQADAAAEVVSKWVTTDDPKLACEDLVYDAFVETAFARGDQDPHEVCVKDQEFFQKNPEKLPTAVKVSKVTGTDDVFARVDFEDVGGKSDGIPSFANLYYEDGDWRIIELYAVE